MTLESPDAISLAQAVDAQLTNQRTDRYRSEEQAVIIAAFSAGDQTVISALYDFLKELGRILDEGGAAESVSARVLAAWGSATGLFEGIRLLGAGVNDPRLAAALHDIRGGALTAVFVQLARLQRAPANESITRALAIATRDHSKIMRNVVAGLDPEARRRDTELEPHTVAQLAEALRQFSAVVGERRVEADVALDREDAVIAETCVECAAVDRVAYNLLNNAAVHTTAERIEVALLSLERDVRIAVVNSISDAQRDVVLGVLARDPHALFGDFTTTGSGRGLAIASELVARAYGVLEPKTLIDRGILGATIAGDRFLAWFHWPTSTMGCEV